MATLSFDEQYICWVQRALIRNAWPGLKVNGQVSEAYRDVVRRFQTENGLKLNGDVDSPTQDRLIKLNHADVDYTAWVQTALVKAGFLSVAQQNGERIMDLAKSATRKAIKRFQKRPGSGLSGDGWVGVKTELALMKFSSSAPPDDTGRPAPCQVTSRKPAQNPKPSPVTEDDQLNAKLRSAVEHLEDYSSLYVSELCLARKLLSNKVDDEVPQFIQYFNNTPLKRSVPSVHLRALLKNRMQKRRTIGLSVTTLVFVGWLTDLLGEMRSNVTSAWRADCYLSETPKARSLAKKLSRHPKHVYSCPGVRSVVDDWLARKGLYECTA